MSTVSIVIPVHNAEKYLAACVESALRQMDANDEIILVENGSEDGSAHICEKYAQNAKNVEYIQLGPVGVSVARNEGIQAARNSWITFLDADDKLLDGALSCIKSRDLPQDAEVLVCDYSRSETDQCGQTDQFTPISADLLARGVLRFAKYKRKIQKVAPIDDYNNWASWGKFYKRQLLLDHKAAFPEKIRLSEDTAFCFQVYCAADHVYAVKEKVYFYRRNEGSAIHGYKKWLVQNNEQLLAWFERYRARHFQAKNVWKRDFAALYSTKLIDICRCLQDARYGEALIKRQETFQKLCHTDYLCRAIHDAPFFWLINGRRNNLRYAGYLFYLKFGLGNRLIQQSHSEK